MNRPTSGELLNARNRWLWSAVTCITLLILLFAYSRITFETNDDCSIIAIAAGYLTGTPNPATVSTSYGYGLLLTALYRLCGNVPWHTVLLLLSNAISLTVLLHTCFLCCARLKIHCLYGLLMFASLFCGVLLPFTAQLQFTAVAGSAFASALLLMVTLPDHASPRLNRLHIAFGIACVLISFGIRPKVALMLLPLAVLVALILWLRRKGNRRAVAIFCACLLVGYGVMYALDAKLYESEPGWSEFEAFDEEATALLDYNAQPLNEEQLHIAAQTAGWSDALMRMARNWYFLDGRINTEQLAKVNAALKLSQATAAFPSNVPVILKSTASILKRYPLFQWNILGWGVAALIAVWLAVKRKDIWLVVQIVAPVAYAIALIAYFYGVLNRFPFRLAFCAAYPMYALLLTGLTDVLADGAYSMEHTPKARRAGALMLLLVILGGGFGFAAYGMKTLRPYSDGEHSNAALAGAVNDYAAQHRGNVYVTDYCEDFSPFVTYTPGAMQNLIYWGNGIGRSPAGMAQLYALGYEHFNAEQFFDGGVYLLLVGGEQTLQRVTEYLTSDYDLKELALVEQTPNFSVYKAVRMDEP